MPTSANGKTALGVYRLLSIHKNRGNTGLAVSKKAPRGTGAGALGERRDINQPLCKPLENKRGRVEDPPSGTRVAAHAPGGAPRKGRGPRGAPSGSFCSFSPAPVAGRRRPALPPAGPAVPSALGGLTSGFGMGPGVPPLPWPPTGDGRGEGGSPPPPQGRTATRSSIVSHLPRKRR